MPELIANSLLGSALSQSNPFPGLRPYEEQDASWFYGRSGEINELLKRLRRLHFVAVIGASGSGKSSLVRAGVLPQIRDGYLDAEWLIATFRPGEQPVANLAEAFTPPDPAGFTSNLHSGSMGLVRALERSELAAHRKVLILVDQFEELFQFAQRSGDSAQEEVKEFLKLLLTAANSDDVPVYVVVTMRLEWLNECAAYAGLAEAINQGIYLVPQMSRRQFQQAILGPLEAAGGSVTTALLGRMLNDLDARSDQLPVLQHALMRIWERVGASEPFDMPAYESVGTFSRCLSAHAEEVFGELGDWQKKVAELLFRAITQVSKNRKIRRPRLASEILRSTGVEFEELESVVLTFSKPGRSFLVTTAGGLRPESVIDISHEALIRQWARLSGWVDNEAEIRSRISRLEEDAAEWDRDRAALKGCLYRGSQLTRAEELRPALDPQSKAIAFLKESGRVRFWRLVWTRGSIAVGAILLIALAAYLSFLKVDSTRKSLALARALQLQAETEANLASLQAKKAQEFQADLVKKIDAAKGNSSALAAIAQSIQAKRVYLQYVSGDLSTAQKVQAQLRKQGYTVPGSEQVARVNGFPFSQVRYFHHEDLTDAYKIANSLIGLIPGNFRVVSTDDPKGVVPSGQFEVWLVPTASGPQQAQSNPVAPAPAPPSVAQDSKPAPTPALVVHPAPTLEASLSATKVQPGQRVILTWRTEDAASVGIVGIADPSDTQFINYPAQPPNSTLEMYPQVTSKYIITANSQFGTTSKVLTLEVTPPPAAVAANADPYAAVKAAMTRYKDAYESESVDDLRRAWPTISKAQQKNVKFVFDQFNAIRLTLNCRDQDIHVEGDAATATCQQTAVYTQKGKKQPEQTTPTTFKLKRQGDSWVVDAVQ